SEEHTSELQSLTNLVCRLLLEKKNFEGDSDDGEFVTRIMHNCAAVEHGDDGVSDQNHGAKRYRLQFAFKRPSQCILHQEPAGSHVEQQILCTQAGTETQANPKDINERENANNQ